MSYGGNRYVAWPYSAIERATESIRHKDGRDLTLITMTVLRAACPNLAALDELVAHQGEGMAAPKAPDKPKRRQPSLPVITA